MTKSWTKAIQGKGGVALPCSWRGYSPLVGEGTEAGIWTNGYIVSRGPRLTNSGARLLSVFSFLLSPNPTQRIVPLTFRMYLPYLLKPLWNLFQTLQVCLLDDSKSSQVGNNDQPSQCVVKSKRWDCELSVIKTP